MIVNIIYPHHPFLTAIHHSQIELTKFTDLSPQMCSIKIVHIRSWKIHKKSCEKFTLHTTAANKEPKNILMYTNHIVSYLDNNFLVLEVILYYQKMM